MLVWQSTKLILNLSTKFKPDIFLFPLSWWTRKSKSTDPQCWWNPVMRIFVWRDFKKNLGKVIVFSSGGFWNHFCCSDSHSCTTFAGYISANPHWSSSRHVDAIWLKSNVCKLDPNIVSYQNNSPTTRMCSHCHIAKSLTPIVFITYS